MLAQAAQHADVGPIVHAFHRAFLAASAVAALAALVASRMPARALWKS
jgi:hypothetical protein